MNNKTIKENLYKKRIEMNLTQEEMASKIGISRQAYINLEHGKTNVISPNIERIAEVAGVKPEILVLGYDPHERNNATLKDIESLSNANDDLKSRINLLNDLVNTKDRNIDSLEMFVKYLSRQLQENFD